MLSLTSMYKIYYIFSGLPDKYEHVAMHICTHFYYTGFLLYFILGNGPCHLSPALYPTGGGVIFHSRGQIKHLIVTAGAQLHPQYSFEITRVADRRNLFHSRVRRLVRQMECSEHWCEPNDDTISIIALACACVISIDLYGVCEETDKSS